VVSRARGLLGRDFTEGILGACRPVFLTRLPGGATWRLIAPVTETDEVRDELAREFIGTTLMAWSDEEKGAERALIQDLARTSLPNIR